MCFDTAQSLSPIFILQSGHGAEAEAALWGTRFPCIVAASAATAATAAAVMASLFLFRLACFLLDLVSGLAVWEAAWEEELGGVPGGVVVVVVVASAGGGLEGGVELAVVVTVVVVLLGGRGLMARRRRWSSVSESLRGLPRCCCCRCFFRGEAP